MCTYQSCLACSHIYFFYVHILYHTIWTQATLPQPSSMGVAHQFFQKKIIVLQNSIFIALCITNLLLFFIDYLLCTLHSHKNYPELLQLSCEIRRYIWLTNELWIVSSLTAWFTQVSFLNYLPTLYEVDSLTSSALRCVESHFHYLTHYNKVLLVNIQKLAQIKESHLVLPLRKKVNGYLYYIGTLSPRTILGCFVFTLNLLEFRITINVNLLVSVWTC